MKLNFPASRYIVCHKYMTLIISHTFDDHSMLIPLSSHWVEDVRSLSMLC